MNVLLRNQRDYGELIKSSTDQFSDVKRVYHGSPVLFDIIRGDKTGSRTKDKGSVFVTPYPAIASCFVISKNTILGKLEDQGINTIGICFKYDVWNWPVEKLVSIPREIHVKIDEPDIQPFSGISKGYIYTIDFTKYEQISRETNLNRDSDVELVIPGNVEYMYRTPVEIRYFVSSLEYEAPYGVDQLKELGLDYLINDPVHLWRAKTGIELIHNEPDISELNRIWSNWKVMPENLKKISEAKSIELFGKTNEEHFNDLDTEYDFPGVVASALRRLQDYIYGCKYNDGAFVTNKSEMDRRGGSDLVIQTPEEMDDLKGGMCHDASVYLDEVLTESGVDHICVYVASDEPPFYPTHSWVVAKDNYGCWRVLDVFSSGNCLWGEKFISPKEAIVERSKNWLREYSPNSKKTAVYFSLNMPNGGVDLLTFDKEITENFDKMYI